MRGSLSVTPIRAALPAIAHRIAGTVEQIGHAQTVVRGADGRLYLIPNGYFLEHVVEKAIREEAAELPGRQDR